MQHVSVRLTVFLYKISVKYLAWECFCWLKNNQLQKAQTVWNEKAEGYAPQYFDYMDQENKFQELTVRIFKYARAW